MATVVTKAGNSGKPSNPASVRIMGIRSFERSLPMLLMRAREAVMQRFRPHLRKHDITEQQWRILRVLAEQKNVDMVALSTLCSIQAPSLSRTIPLLVERGLVRRGSHGNDRRRTLVDLTPSGRALFRTMSAESALIYSELEAEIGHERLRGVYQLLDELISMVGVEDASGSEED